MIYTIAMVSDFTRRQVVETILADVVMILVAIPGELVTGAVVGVV
jgi:hypothetical protein